MSELARRIETDDPDVWAVSVVGGYAFADTPDTGVAACVVTIGRRGRAERHLDALGEIAVSRASARACRANGTSMPPSTTRSPARSTVP